jgi:hypothetical protein
MVFAGEVMVSDQNGYVHWFDKATGEHHHSMRYVIDGGMHSDPVVLNSQVIFYADNGLLSLMKVKIRS